MSYIYIKLYIVYQFRTRSELGATKPTNQHLTAQGYKNIEHILYTIYYIIQLIIISSSISMFSQDRSTPDILYDPAYPKIVNELSTKSPFDLKELVDTIDDNAMNVDILQNGTFVDLKLFWGFIEILKEHNIYGSNRKHVDPKLDTYLLSNNITIRYIIDILKNLVSALDKDMGLKSYLVVMSGERNYNNVIHGQTVTLLDKEQIPKLDALLKYEKSNSSVVY